MKTKRGAVRAVTSVAVGDRVEDASGRTGIVTVRSFDNASGVRWDDDGSQGIARHQGLWVTSEKPASEVRLIRDLLESPAKEPRP